MTSKIRLAPLATVALALALALPAPAAGQDSQDPMVRAVLAYDLTLPAFERYVAALRDLADLAKRSPKAVAPLRSKSAQAKIKTLEEAAAFLESNAAVRPILERHSLRGLDFAVLPVAFMQARIVVLGWSQGREFPPDQVNVRSAKAVQADVARFDELSAEATKLREKTFGK